MLGAARALHAQGQQLAWSEVLAASDPTRGATPAVAARLDQHVASIAGTIADYRRACEQGAA
jgi:hypothetical protein